MTPFVPNLTMLAYVLHIGGGTIGLFSGAVAAFARKGGKLHRNAGNVFTVSMLVMAAFAIYLAVVKPGQIGNLFGGTFAGYLVATAWLTVWRKPGSIGVAEKLAFTVVLCLLLFFGTFSFYLVTGLPLPFKSAVAIKGPVLIAMYSMTFVIAIAAVADIKVMIAGGVTGAQRIARHLWRMCLGLLLATGSAFTNGLPRLLPGHVHVGLIFFLPQLVPLGLLIFWMIRVRLTGWIRRNTIKGVANAMA
ncbi:MAG TPA: hypothetical protein VHT03_01895 [Rhizomicrobium sp.]|jgi:hypothetical protein|nr:hypothetical protein [Rhizomicrobium sp.]